MLPTVFVLIAAAAQAAEVAPTPAPDQVPPQVSIRVSPATLWPTNEEFVEVVTVVTAFDRVDPSPKIALVSITPSDRLDPGDDVQDARFGTDDRRFRLRPTRGRGNGERVYRITYHATDAAGNVGSATARVRVANSPRPAVSPAPGARPSPPDY